MVLVTLLMMKIRKKRDVLVQDARNIHANRVVVRLRLQVVVLGTQVAMLGVAQTITVQI